MQTRFLSLLIAVGLGAGQPAISWAQTVPPAPVPLLEPGDLMPPAPLDRPSVAQTPPPVPPAPPLAPPVPAPSPMAPPPSPFAPPLGGRPPALLYPPPPSAPPYVTEPMAPPPVAFSSVPASYGWTAGLGAYYMQPVFQSNPAFINGHVNSSGAAVYHETDFSEHANVAPLAWLGVTFDGGWGIRGRWFEFSTTTAASTNVGSQGLYLPGGSQAFSVAMGDPVAASNLLYMDVYDLELTYSRSSDCWAFLASAGVRYVHLNQSYQLTAVDGFAGTTNVYSSNNFDGVGPTVALEAHRRIGHSHWSLYGNARGSLVFGPSHQHATINDPVNGTFQFGGCPTTLMSIAELEAGFEWARCWGRFNFFTQTGFVGQFWGGGGNATQPLGVSAIGIPTATNFGFFGGSFRAGLNF